MRFILAKALVRIAKLLAVVALIVLLVGFTYVVTVFIAWLAPDESVTVDFEAVSRIVTQTRYYWLLVWLGGLVLALVAAVLSIVVNPDDHLLASLPARE